MGCGLILVWPKTVEKSRFHMGIIDGTAVRHALPKPVTHYDYQTTNEAMSKYLRQREALPRPVAFLTTELFSESAGDHRPDNIQLA
jgi:hypothetical protein